MPRKARLRRRTTRPAGSTPDARPDELLPEWPGPRLHPYKDRNPKIKFEERLHDYDGSDFGGSEGYVFKVRINSVPFALKMFKFFDAEDATNQFSARAMSNAMVTVEEFEAHMDPFYAECRAYGRMNEFYDARPRRKKRGIIAARCYGYLYISESDEEHLRKCHDITAWNRPVNEEGRPIRALVKQLIETKEPVDKAKRSLRQMRNDLWTLHELRVYPRNIFPSYYRGGLLVNFSMAFTSPHCTEKFLAPWQIKGERNSDMRAFDMMIEALGIKTSIRAVR